MFRRWDTDDWLGFFGVIALIGATVFLWITLLVYPDRFDGVKLAFIAIIASGWTIFWLVCAFWIAQRVARERRRPDRGPPADSS